MSKLHGNSNTRLYKTWKDMIYRCNRKGNKSYKYYGGRGIKICDEWKQNFITFRNWALANGYQDNLQIDRIDNDGDYCPKNCRWVTRLQNQYNRGPNINSSSKYKGVSWNKEKKKWSATIRYNKKSIHIAYFTEEKMAAIAYNKKAKELRGEYAYLNEVAA